jgi:hypothetical protein
MGYAHGLTWDRRQWTAGPYKFSTTGRMFASMSINWTINWFSTFLQPHTFMNIGLLGWVSHSMARLHLAASSRWWCYYFDFFASSNRWLTAGPEIQLQTKGMYYWIAEYIYRAHIHESGGVRSNRVLQPELRRGTTLFKHAQYLDKKGSDEGRGGWRKRTVPRMRSLWFSDVLYCDPNSSRK